MYLVYRSFPIETLGAGLISITEPPHESETYILYPPRPPSRRAPRRYLDLDGQNVKNKSQMNVNVTCSTRT